MLMPLHPRVHFALDGLSGSRPRLPTRIAVASTPYDLMIANGRSVPR